MRAAKAEAGGPPVFVAECSAGGHDDASAAAGVVRTGAVCGAFPGLRGGGGAAVCSRWAFSDVFDEEQCLNPTPCHGGCGLVN